MELTHFLALLPLLILFCMTLVFYKIGLLHLVTLGYTMALGFFAVSNNWEIMFFPILAGVGIISAIIFFIAMTKGEIL